MNANHEEGLFVFQNIPKKKRPPAIDRGTLCNR
jgi:hypothetical protein